MMSRPHDSDRDEAVQICQELREDFRESAKAGSGGTLRSKTMIVIMTAITPSLKDSTRFISIAYSVVENVTLLIVGPRVGSGRMR